MRLSQPRIAPLSDAEMGPEQKEALKDFGADILNIFRTLVRAPKALTRFNAWGGYVLSRRNDLPGATGSVNLTGASDGTWVYSALPAPVTLETNKAYYLVSSETAGGDRWHGCTYTVTASGGLSVISTA